MTSRISHTSVDARDAYAQSVFWSEVLDFTEDPDDPNEPGHEECLIMSRDRSQLLLFITVPDGKTVKNRVHLDLRPVDRTREQETERILAWLERPDTRLVETSGDWVSPVRGAARFAALLNRAEAAASGKDSAVRSSVTDRLYDARSLRL